MSLSDLASLGSLVSGAAVVFSLALVLLQMRQTDRTLRATMQESRTARYVEQVLRPTEPFLCEVVTRAQDSGLDMPSTMVNAFVRHSANIFWNSEGVFFQHRSGTIDRVAFDSDMAVLRKFLEIPAYRVGWAMNREFATGEFKAFVDKLVSEIKPVPYPDAATTWKTLLSAELANIASAKQL